MSTVKGVSNINVSSYSPYNGDASANWEKDGFRFHVWFHTPTRSLRKDVVKKRPILYKNPLTARPKEPGYFNTIYLNAEASSNAAVIEHVFEVINRDGLIAKAIKKHEADEAARVERERLENIDKAVKEFERLHSWLKANANDERLASLASHLSLDDLDELKARFP